MKVTTQKELAKQLGTTDRSIRNWLEKYPDHPDASGGYDVDVWRAWAQSKGLLEAGRKSNPQDAAIRSKTLEVKLARQVLAAEREKIELKKLQGELVERDKVHDFLMEVATMFHDITATLQRAGHTEAVKIISDRMEQVEQVIVKRFGT